jgi:tRNA A-37 threonylcarbamoyl transferase component Bud32
LDDATLDRVLDGDRFDSGEGAVARLVALVGSASPSGPGSVPPALTPQDLEAAGFRTLGLLGSGVHATVWDAEDATLGRRVALKVVRSQGMDLSAQRTFLREARMLARVDHPNVVRLWSAERSGDRLMLALERIDGRTLREIVMRDGPLDARAAARIVLDVARGLAAVHAAGVLHRDLHPGNVMRRSDGSAVLLDFSLARGDGAERLRSGGTLGTPAYEAPEVLRGGEPTERSDVYALGMLLVWLATGRTPLRGASWRELRASAVSGDRATLAEIAPGMPRDLRAVAERAIQVDPARRTPDAHTFARNLQAALGRKRRRAAFALGLVLALGVAGGAFELVRRVESSSRAEEAALQNQKKREREKSQEELSRLEPPTKPSGLIELAGAALWDPELHGFHRSPLVVPDQFERIQDAIRAAVSGDVVGVREGTYEGTLEIADLSVAIVSLDGPGAAVLNGDGFDGPVVLVHALESEVEHEVLLWGLSITGGKGRVLNQRADDGSALYGGGVFVQGANLEVRLEACELWGNGYGGTTLGGGLAARDSLEGDGRVTLVDCLIVGNAAWDGGAILADNARVTLEGCIVADNFAGIYGGIQGGIALANGSNLEVSDSTLWGNRDDQIGEHGHAEPSPDWIVVRSRVQASEAQMLSEPSPFLDAEAMDYRPRVPERDEHGRPPLPWARRIDASPRSVESLGAFVADAFRTDVEILRVPGDFQTIEEAIEDAPEGAVILIGPGVYYEQLVLHSRSLTLVGEFGASATVLDVTHVDGSAIDVLGPVAEGAMRPICRIQGLTVRGGNGRVMEEGGRYGGALAVSGHVDLDLEGVVLWESGLEVSTAGGGGLWAAAGARVSARNCLFARNRAFSSGAALFIDDASVRLDQCTLIGVDGAPKPLVHVAPAGRLEVRHSILWGPTGVIVFDPECREHTGIVVSDSSVRGGFPGSGVIDLSPEFADPERDWRTRLSPEEVGSTWGFEPFENGGD